MQRIGFAASLALAGLALDACAEVDGADQSSSENGGETLVLLGTAGGPKLRADRAQPANLIVVGGKPYVFDCGEGCVDQIIQAGYEPSAVEQAFITHMHLDHSGGIGALAAFRWTGGASTKLSVHGPSGTGALVEAAVTYFSIPASVHSSEVPNLGSIEALVEATDIKQSGGEIFEVFADDNIRVTAVENSHFDHIAGEDIGFGALRSYSYRIDSQERSVVITGDTGPSQALERLADGADIIVSEVLDVDGVMVAFRSMGDLPEAQLPAIEAQMRAKHLTPEDVGQLAKSANVGKVVLTHFASGGAMEDVDSMVATVKTVFDGEVIAGEDLRAF